MRLRPLSRSAAAVLGLVLGAVAVGPRLTGGSGEAAPAPPAVIGVAAAGPGPSAALPAAAPAIDAAARPPGTTPTPDGEAAPDPAPDRRDGAPGPASSPGTAGAGTSLLATGGLPVGPALRVADLPGPGAVPTRLRIPAIGVDAPVGGVGASGGELDIFDDTENVAWFRHGPAPGEAGSAVLAAHVDHWRDGAGVFLELRRLEPGAAVEVELDDGTTRRFVVTDRRSYAKERLPAELFARSGEPAVTLITCGGAFDRRTRSYADNVVVRAVPAPD